MQKMYTGLLALALASLGLAACDDETGATADAAPGAGGGGGTAGEGGQGGEGNVGVPFGGAGGDGEGGMGGGAGGDGGMGGDGGAGGGISADCDRACKTLADCAVDPAVCEGIDSGLRDAIYAWCTGQCADDPTFGEAINSGDMDCQAAVEVVGDCEDIETGDGGAGGEGGMGAGGEGGVGGMGAGGEGGVGGMGVGGEGGMGVGGEGGGEGGEGGMGGDVGMGGEGGGEGGMGGDVGMGGEGGGLPPGDIQGDIYFAERLAAGDQPFLASAEGSAVFSAYQELPMDAMPSEQAGDCGLFLLDNPDDPGVGRRFAAGDLLLSGGVGDQTLSYDGIGEGYSVNAGLVFDLWSPGVEVTVSAPGSDDIGGFNMSTPGPDEFAEVSPNQEAPMSRAGTTISWAPGNGTQIVAYLRNSGGNQVIRCTSPDDGSVEVPAEAFGWLPGDVDRLTLDLRRASRARVATPEPVGDIYLVLERIHTDRNLDLDD